MTKNMYCDAKISLFRDLLHFRKKHLVVRFFSDVVNVDVADDALFIDHENRSFGKPFCPLDPVFAGNLTQGAEIAQERKRDPAETLCPRLEAGDVINADAQDLGI
jgi:hypothetical protein